MFGAIVTLIYGLFLLFFMKFEAALLSTTHFLFVWYVVTTILQTPLIVSTALGVGIVIKAVQRMKFPVLVPDFSNTFGKIIWRFITNRTLFIGGAYCLYKSAGDGVLIATGLLMLAIALYRRSKVVFRNPRRDSRFSHSQKPYARI
jgi:hypothetical protein